MIKYIKVSKEKIEFNLLNEGWDDKQIKQFIEEISV